MLLVIKTLLQNIIENIDAGNSNLTESESLKILDYLRQLSIDNSRLSKYAACKYLNISRATFDNYIKEDKLLKVNTMLGLKNYPGRNQI